MTAQAAAKRDLTPITDAFLSLVPILLDNARRYRRHLRVELTSKANFIWELRCHTVKVTVGPMQLIGAYSVAVNFSGGDSFLLKLEAELYEQLTKQLKGGADCPTWDMWDDHTAANGELRFNVSEPGI